MICAWEYRQRRSVPLSQIRRANDRQDKQPRCHGLALTYLLTPYCRVLLQKLTGLQLVKKFPAFHGTRRFITALTSVRYMSLSQASPIQSIYAHPTSWRSILILSTHLRLGLPSSLFPSGFPTKNLYTPSPDPYAPYAQPISSFSILSHSQYWLRSTNHLAPRYSISSSASLPSPSQVKIFSSTPCPQTLSGSFPLAMLATKFHIHTKQQTKIRVLYIFIFKFLDSNLEDKRFCTE